MPEIQAEDAEGVVCANRPDCSNKILPPKAISKPRQETKATIETLCQETRADIAAAKNSIIVWVVGLNMAMVGLVIATTKLL